MYMDINKYNTLAVAKMLNGFYHFSLDAIASQIDTTGEFTTATLEELYYMYTGEYLSEEVVNNLDLQDYIIDNNLLHSEYQHTKKGGEFLKQLKTALNDIYLARVLKAEFISEGGVL